MVLIFQLSHNYTAVDMIFHRAEKLPVESMRTRERKL